MRFLPKESSSKYQLTFHQRGEYHRPDYPFDSISTGIRPRLCTRDNAVPITIFPRLGQLSSRVSGLFQQEQQGQPKPRVQSGCTKPISMDYDLGRPAIQNVGFIGAPRLDWVNCRFDNSSAAAPSRLRFARFVWATTKEEWSQDAVELPSLSRQLANQKAYYGTDRLAVAVAAADSFAFPSVQSCVLVESLLARLSTVEASPKPKLVEALQGITIPLLSNPHLLVISTRSNQTEWLRAQFRGLAADRLLARLQIKWLDVTHGDLEPYFSWN